jgi:hypothetical protein
VAALRAWLDAAGITEGVIFRRIFNKRAQRITDQRLAPRNVAAIVKQGAARLGFDPSTFATACVPASLQCQDAPLLRPMPC